jgi:hypothetical protein
MSRSGAEVGVPAVTLAALRPLLGADVVVETAAGPTPARLLSAVRDTAWFVVDDLDVVVHLDQIKSVRSV